MTVDNGVSSGAGVDAAREAGIPVLVTDHHLPGAVLPRAEVIVNPNLSGQPIRESGAGRRRRCFLRGRRPGEDAGLGRISSRGIAGSGGARDGGGCGAARPQQPGLGVARAEAASVPAVASPAFARCSNPRAAPFEQITAADLGFARRAALERRGPADRHERGHRLPAWPTIRPRRQRLAGNARQLNDERREIEQRMQLEAVDIAADVRCGDDGTRSWGSVPLR